MDVNEELKIKKKIKNLGGGGSGVRVEGFLGGFFIVV